MIHKEAQRKSYLDVLKAIAILAVVLYHSGFMTYGYWGVDIFLVISGYLTTLSLSKRFAEKETLSAFIKKYFQFLIDRVTRLLPLLLIICSVCMIMGYFVMVDDTYESLCQSVIGTSFFANNVVEMLARGDYWRGDTIYAPLMHTWYIGVLMQFYVVFPLFWGLAYLDREKPRRTLTVILAVSLFISLCIYLSDGNVARRFYMLPSRFFEFAAGGLIAICGTDNTQKTAPSIWNRLFIGFAYVLLIALLALQIEFIPTTVRLLLVVGITVVLVMSPGSLENKWTGNAYMAKIGMASYSIYLWHQVIFAFYRSLVCKNFSAYAFIGCILLIAVLSLLSYLFIEKPTSAIIRSPKRRIPFYLSTGLVFFALNFATFLIYLHAGVVRDIPELEVSRQHPVRGMWADYNNRTFELDKPFETDKPHWLVVGNSFGRDFVNVIRESERAEGIEISYSADFNYMMEDHADRFLKADKIFIASMNFTEEFVRDVEIRGLAAGLSLNDIWIVGDKYYGQDITQIYVKRFSPDYYQTKVQIPKSLQERNKKYHSLYGERYLDLMELAGSGSEWIPVFTEDRKLISHDCIHLTRSGASYLASKIDWSRF